MARFEEKVKLVSVTNNYPDAVSTFLNLGGDYLSGLPPDEREKFLQSILARQGEPDRWSLLLEHENEYLGFVHMKVDRDERPGLGCILEFYIVPNKRRLGWGCRLFNLSIEILRARNVKHIWLLTNPMSEQFWHTLGFRETGEMDKETRQKVMIMSL